MGVDEHEPSIDLARRIGSDDIAYVQADALHVELPQADVVISVAMLHHVDMADGLRAMAALVAPGGLLLVVGLASRRPRRHRVGDGTWRPPLGSEGSVVCPPRPARTDPFIAFFSVLAERVRATDEALRTAGPSPSLALR